MFNKRTATARDELVGRLVMVNDLAGDGYEGHIFKVDDSGYHLIGSGAGKVKYIPGDKSSPLEMAQVFIPASNVKFVDLGG